MNDVEKFIGRLKTDSEFASKYRNLLASEVIETAKNDGYSISEMDFLKTGELSQEDLESIAGGASTFERWWKLFKDEWFIFED